MYPYLHSKYYLIDATQKRVIQIDFDNRTAASNYREENQLSTFNWIADGGVVKRLIGEGRIIEPEPYSSGGRVAPLVGPKFDMGMLVMTSGVAGEVSTDAGFAIFVNASLKRHANADWGDVWEEDKQANDEALKTGYRLFSSYEPAYPMKKIWIITEADRSVTTILFPDEY
jgi:hypothetical protein